MVAGFRPPRDCNENGVVDATDIADGTSEDENADGIPDECQPPDCNGNGIDDAVDIESETSLDEDADGIPDECQVCVEPPEGLLGWWPGDGNAEDIWESSHGSTGNGVEFSEGLITSGSGQAFDLSGLADGVFADLDAEVNCAEEDGVEAGLVIGWVNEGTGEVLPPGDYALFTLCFQPAEGEDGGLCSSLRFVECLGVPEAPARNAVATESRQLVPLSTAGAEVCGDEDPFRRGDPNGDGRFDIADAIFLLGCMFLGGDCSTCPDAADSNDDGRSNITDPVYLLRWRFAGGEPPPRPFSRCGIDRTVDGLGECVSPACRQ